LTTPLKLKDGDEGCWFALHGNGTSTIVGFLYFTLGGVTLAMKADDVTPVGSWAELSNIADSGFGEAAGKAFDTKHPEQAGIPHAPTIRGLYMYWRNTSDK
jgi:hypothetical protein